MGKKKTTTTNTGLDPASQKYVDQMRQQGQGAANVALAGPEGGGGWFGGPETMSVGDQAAQFFNPYQQNVVGAVQGQYDQLRADAMNQSKMGGAGTFGGSRNAVMAGARLGQLDQGQAGTIAGLLSNGYQNAVNQGVGYQQYQHGLADQQRQNPLFAQQMAQQFQQGGMGPTGSTTSQTTSGNWASNLGDGLKTAAGIGATLYGAGMFGGGGMPGGGGGAPGGYTGAPNLGMPSQWNAPQWNPQYRGPYG